LKSKRISKIRKSFDLLPIVNCENLLDFENKSGGRSFVFLDRKRELVFYFPKNSNSEIFPSLIAREVFSQKGHALPFLGFCEHSFYGWGYCTNLVKPQKQKVDRAIVLENCSSILKTAERYGFSRKGSIFNIVAEGFFSDSKTTFLGLQELLEQRCVDNTYYLFPCRDSFNSYYDEVTKKIIITDWDYRITMRNFSKFSIKNFYTKKEANL
jgi:hypothetical protein